MSSLTLPTPIRVKFIDEFSRKMLTSGYKREQTKSVIEAGIKGYERAVVKHMSGKRALHQRGKDGVSSRNRKKLLEKSTWFKEKERDSEDQSFRGTLGEEIKFSGKRNTIKSSTVLFVDQTRRGELAAAIREKEEELSEIAGWKLKVVEKSGTTLTELLVRANPWAGLKCGRADCWPCETGGEKDSRCFKRNVLYETRCHPCAEEGLEVVYIGETSRTGYERGGEHANDAMRRKGTVSIKLLKLG